MILPLPQSIKKILIKIKISIEAGEDPQNVINAVSKEHNLKADDLWSFYLRC